MTSCEYFYSFFTRCVSTVSTIQIISLKWRTMICLYTVQMFEPDMVRTDLQLIYKVAFLVFGSVIWVCNVIHVQLQHSPSMEG